jgi:hypothetical protein
VQHLDELDVTVGLVETFAAAVEAVIIQGLQPNEQAGAARAGHEIEELDVALHEARREAKPLDAERDERLKQPLRVAPVGDEVEVDEQGLLGPSSAGCRRRRPPRASGKAYAPQAVGTTQKSQS